MADNVMQGEFHNVNFILPAGLERIEINVFRADDGEQERPGRRPSDAGNFGAELIANELGRRMDSARREGGRMDGDKVLELLQPMREVLNDLEGAALGDERLSAKTLLDLAGKLTAVELAFLDEYNRELTGELDRLETERAELMDPARGDTAGAVIQSNEDHGKGASLKDQWEKIAENLNALPRSEKADLAMHLAGKYADRTSKPTRDRLASLEVGYPVDHVLIAGLISAGAELKELERLVGL